MPSSQVSSWIRRSRSTSSCEYSRVPLGERCGLISPRVLVHPQRLRVHLRQLGGDGDHEDALVAGEAAHVRSPPSSRRAAASLARVAVHHLATARRVPPPARARGPSARRSRSGSGCRRAPRPAERRRALAAQALDGAVTWSRRGTRSFLVPCSVGTSTSAPRIASVTVIGTSTSKLSPLRRNTGDSSTRRDHVEVAGRAAAQAGLALAGQPDPRALLDARRGC